MVGSPTSEFRQPLAWNADRRRERAHNALLGAARKFLSEGCSAARPEADAGALTDEMTFLGLRMFGMN
ncbi:hypothetical protein [Nocardia gipuzkoensis]